MTRDELYRLVWSEPMTKIATQFDVSGSYLARICTLLNVPRPERGYWAKLAVGKAPPHLPLPEPRPGDPLVWVGDGAMPRVARPKPAAPLGRTTKPAIKIPSAAVHGLIRGARGHMGSGRPVDDGAFLKPFKKLMVDVTASKAGADKALALANDLFNAFESIGHRVVIAPTDGEYRRVRIEEREAPSKARNYWEYSGLWSPWRPTIVFIGTVAIGLAVVEMSAPILLRYVNGNYIPDRDYVAPQRSRYADRSWTTTRELPCGRMRVIAYSPYGRVSWSKTWDEVKGGSLRPKLKEIVETLESFAPELVRLLEAADHRAELERIELERKAEQARRDEDRRLVSKSFDDSRAGLATVIERWTKAMSVEQFLAGVEARAAELPEEERGRVGERLSLARELLGSQDPLDFIRDWRTPDELYRPRYAADQVEA